MTELYPLKFKPILKERVWGGSRLATAYGKEAPEGMKIGESWELSGLQDDISLVTNGFLEGNNLEEIAEVYMGDLVGEKIFEKFGREFPLLIKLIDANDDLSIQVHPPDELSRERHHAYGKTEMWYVLEADNDAKIYTGFRQQMTKEEFRSSLEKGDIAEKLNIEKPLPGDVFFLPAGRVHAIGRGVVLAEIQQTSDITYRIWDWNRNGLDGKPRELHTELSVDAIDYKNYDSYKTRIEPEQNGTVNLADCDYFTCNLIELDRSLSKDYSLTDSFIVYICASGEASIEWEDGKTLITKGETLLIPAIMDNLVVRPLTPVKILEVYIREIKNK